MRFLFFLIIYVNALAYANPCGGIGADLCAEAKSEGQIDYHADFYTAIKNGFNESLEETEMEDLVCRNFERSGGKLVPNFDFNRSCWSWLYRGAIKKAGIKNCSDFLKVGADRPFVENCQETLNKTLGEFVSSRASIVLENMIDKAKARLLAAFENKPYLGSIQRSLNTILPNTSNYVYRNLYKLQTDFVEARELCSERYDGSFCAIYGNSTKKVLSLGGYVFLNPTILETVIAKKIAEYVGEAIHPEIYGERLLVYMRYLQGEVTRQQLERVIARAKVRNELNKSTNTIIVLRKLFNEERKFADEFFNMKAKYFCYQDPRLKEDPVLYEREKHYQGDFQSLFVEDQTEILACPFDLGSRPTALFEKAVLESIETGV